MDYAFLGVLEQSAAVLLAHPQETDASVAILPGRDMHDAVLRHPATPYAVTATGVVVRAAPGEPPVLFPRVHDARITASIRTAVRANHQRLMRLQTVRRREIAGVLACNPRTADITVRVCDLPPSHAPEDALSSAPFCNARRVCAAQELLPGEVVVGEFQPGPR